MSPESNLILNRENIYRGLVGLSVLGVLQAGRIVSNHLDDPISPSNYLDMIEQESKVGISSDNLYFSFQNGFRVADTTYCGQFPGNIAPKEARVDLDTKGLSITEPIAILLTSSINRFEQSGVIADGIGNTVAKSMVGNVDVLRSPNNHLVKGNKSIDIDTIHTRWYGVYLERKNQNGEVELLGSPLAVVSTSHSCPF